jgi:hypothetical protein
LTFFGLTPEYRNSVFSQIHEIVFHGNGGYDWNTIYNMPIWLRKFTFNSIKEWYEKKQEEEKKLYNQNKTTSPKVSKPNISPTYTAKASK